MNQRTKLLLTENFPYGSAETFLEPEIEAIPDPENWAIIPLRKLEGKIRPLPEGMLLIHFKEVANIKGRAIFTQKGWKLFQILFKEFKASTFRRKYLKRPLFYFKRLFYWRIDWERFKETLDQYHMKPQLLYSYWHAEWLQILMTGDFEESKPRIITRIHGYDFDRRQLKHGFHEFRFQTNAILDHVYSVSEFGRKYFIKDHPEMEAKTTVARLGVKSADLAPIPAMDEEVIRVVSCSNLAKVKRLHLIPALLGKLPYRFEWTHIGDAHGQMNTWSMPDNIVFKNAGKMEHPEVLRHYQQHAYDFFMNTSELEGIPVAMMEAGAAGIPLVGYNVCGIPEIIGIEGLLLNNNISYEEVVKYIKSFILSKRYREKQERVNTQNNTIMKFSFSNYNLIK